MSKSDLAAADFACAILTNAATKAPHYTVDQTLYRYSRQERRYVGLGAEQLAHELCSEFDGEQPQTAAHYRKAVREITLRAPRLTLVGCPQVVIRSNRQVPDPKGRVRNWVPLRNGIFRFDKYVAGKRHFTRCHPRFFSKAVRPFNYDPMADCPLWIERLQQWLDEPSILLIQEWMGYCCVFDSTAEKFCIYLGPARSGKSTAKNVLEFLLGTHNVSNLGLERFSANFGLEELAEVLVNIAADIGNVPVVAEGMIKAITSRDRISFDRKHKSAINICPEARLLFVGNHPPRFKERSKAISDRSLIIAFDRSIPPDQRDPDLAEKLRAEIAGIFNWSMRGLVRLRKTGQFTVPTRMKEELELMKYTANPALEFIEELIEASDSGIVATKQVFEAYEIWCRRNGLTGRDASGGKELGKLLHQTFPKLRKKLHRLGENTRMKFYHGIELHNQEAPRNFRVSEIREASANQENIHDAR